MSKQIEVTKTNTDANDRARLRSIPEILNYLTGQGFKTARRTLYLHKQQGILREQIGGGFSIKAVDDYARRNLERPGIEAPPLAVSGDDRARLMKAQADKIELDNEIKQGLYLIKAEEEARDARLWFAVKTDIENYGSTLIKELVNRIAALKLPDEVNGKIVSLVPELNSIFASSVDELFDRYARAGGIEA